MLGEWVLESKPMGSSGIKRNIFDRLWKRVGSIWTKTTQLVKQEPMVNGNNITYTSTLASSSSSRAFSLVGCHICISKYLTRKGQTTLSRTKNKKYLPQREMRNECIDITNTMHSLQDWSWRLHPVLSGPLQSEHINRRAILDLQTPNQCRNPSTGLFP